MSTQLPPPSRLTRYEQLVLLVIARHINRGTGMTWLSYDTIATESLCCRETAIKSVKKLVSAGILEIAGKRNGRTNQYRDSLLTSGCQPLVDVSNQWMSSTPVVAMSHWYQWM
jgi:hypothetical protein